MRDTKQGFTSASGIPIERVYTPEDTAHIDRNEGDVLSCSREGHHSISCLVDGLS